MFKYLSIIEYNSNSTILKERTVPFKMGLQTLGNNDYVIISNRELSSVLTYFSPEMVERVIDDNLEDRIRDRSPVIGNMVESYESNFKLAIDSYADINRELVEYRYNTYRMIISKLCRIHNLSVTIPENEDPYTLAFYVYDFLISRFQDNIIDFFFNYINQEKDNLYDRLSLEDLRKSKDSTSIYTKKIAKNGDVKMAIICANLHSVLYNMSGFDITLEDIFRYVYLGHPNVSNYLTERIADIGNFYQQYIAPVITGIDNQVIITHLRLLLQGYGNFDFKDYIIGGEYNE